VKEVGVSTSETTVAQTLGGKHARRLGQSTRYIRKRRLNLITNPRFRSSE
jgi:hypothetical protein